MPLRFHGVRGRRSPARWLGLPPGSERNVGRLHSQNSASSRTRCAQADTVPGNGNGDTTASTTQVFRVRHRWPLRREAWKQVRCSPRTDPGPKLVQGFRRDYFWSRMCLSNQSASVGRSLSMPNQPCPFPCFTTNSHSTPHSLYLAITLFDCSIGTSLS